MAATGAAPGSEPVTCETCHGHGEIAQVQRSFLGEIRTLRPCPACRGFGSVIPDPCRECAGDGRVRSRRTLTVKIPAGVDTGTRVQLSEQGEVGPGGGPPGDLYVEILVAQHPTFTRHGNDLHCTVVVPMTAAALGTVLTLPTLEADLVGADGAGDSGLQTSFQLDVEPGTQSGAETVVRGQGVPGLRGGRGDLIVTVSVETPHRLDPRQEELLRELAAIRGEEQPTGNVRPDPEVGLRPAPRRVQPALTRDARDAPAAPRAVARRGHARRVVTVEGDEAHHAVVVRRLRVGEQVTLADGLGMVATGEVSATTKRSFDVRVTSVDEVAEPSPSVTVVQALPKGERGELAVEVLTEIGVQRIVPWAAARSVAVWKGERAAKSHAKWQSTAREAAKQARRAWHPEVPPLASTVDVRALVGGADLAVVLHEDATEPLGAIAVPDVGGDPGRGRARRRPHRRRGRRLRRRWGGRRTPRRRGAPHVHCRRRRRRRAAGADPALGWLSLFRAPAAPRPARPPRRARPSPPW